MSLLSTMQVLLEGRWVVVVLTFCLLPAQKNAVAPMPHHRTDHAWMFSWSFAGTWQLFQ